MRSACFCRKRNQDWPTGVLHDYNHTDSARLIDVVDMIDCALGASTGCLDDLGSVRGKIEVACWVDPWVRLAAGNYSWSGQYSQMLIVRGDDLLTTRAPEVDDMAIDKDVSTLFEQLSEYNDGDYRSCLPMLYCEPWSPFPLSWYLILI